MTAALVGVLVGLALLLVTGPGRRPAPAPALRPRGGGRPARSPGVPGAPSGAGAGRPARRRPPAAGSSDSGARLAAMLVEVAAMLRAGAAPDEAWRSVLGTAMPDRVPQVDQLLAALGPPRPRGGLPPVPWAGARAKAPPVAAVVAAARVADELGAPLAGVLDEVAAAIAAQAEAAADVAAALAAPRSSARVLAWLPAAGLLLGTMLGANPVGVLLGGGLGTASGIAGVALLLVGRRWTAALLRGAERAGDGA